MSDLRGLMQIAPTTGAFLTGQDVAQQMDSEALRQQELAAIIQKRQQDTAQAARMNPLLIDHQGLVNKGLQEGLGSITAKSLQDQLNARMAGETYDSTKQVKLSNDQEKIGENAQKNQARMLDFFQKSAATLSQVPVPMRTQALNSMMQQSGVDPNHPLAQQLIGLAQKDPQNFPQQMMSISDQMGEMAAKGSVAYRQGVDTANINAKSHEQVANIHANATRYSADKAYDARTEVAQLRAEADKAKQGQAKTFEALAASYQMQANSLPEGDPRKAQLQEQAAQALEASQAIKAAAVQGKVDPQGLGLPTQTPPNPLAGGGGKPQPSLADLQKAYPGVSPDELKRRYKQKHGVDLK